jgi:RNA-binding protein 26
VKHKDVVPRRRYTITQEMDYEQISRHVRFSLLSRLNIFAQSLTHHPSDADADVLADYVLALLRHDADTETVRQLCLTETADFLKDDSEKFVHDIFETIQHKTYLPGATLPTSQQSQSFAPPSGPSYGNLGAMAGQNFGSMNGSRKRSYNDRGDGDAQDRGFQGGDMNGRQFKQPRRGGPGGMGRGGYDNRQNGRGGFGGPQSHNGPQQGFQQMPPLPNGMPPLDPNNPLQGLLALQSMGFPIPGMPQMPMIPSPGPQQQSNGRPRGRCRDYDATGYCGRGTSCYYEHIDKPAVPAWTPPNQNDEYNPMTSLLPNLDPSQRPPVPNIQLRGGTRGGRGGGRGDFQNNNRKNGRAEFSSDRPNYDKSNTTIVVENIPEDKFTEEEVRSFFSEFGTITEVSMRPYKRLAIVKYDDWDGANTAYKSPKVIFDNRFVKVYWYTNPDNLPKPPPSSSTSNANGKHEPELNMEEFTRKQNLLQAAHEEKQRKKIELESQKADIARRHEELSKKQAEETRKLKEALAAKTGVPLSPSDDSNKMETETEENEETSALKAKLAALEAEAQELGIDTSTSSLPDTALSSGGRGGYRGRGGAPRGGYRGRGAFVPRGRGTGGYRGRGGAPFGVAAGAAGAGGSVMRLDNRPKTVSLKGVDFTDGDKEEALRSYLLVSSSSHLIPPQ